MTAGIIMVHSSCLQVLHFEIKKIVPDRNFQKILNKFYSTKLAYFTVQNWFITDIPLFLNKHRALALAAKTQFKYPEL